MQQKTRKYLFIAAFLQLVWGLVPSASKIVIDEIPVELYIAIRWSISGIIFALYLMLTRHWARISLRDTLLVAGLGILGYGIASLGFLYGLKIGGVTNFALMAAFSPAITSALSVWVLREKPAPLFFMALPVSIFGLILLVMGKSQFSSLQRVGGSLACILTGCVLESLTFVFSKKFKSKMSVPQYLAIAQVSCAAFLWLVQGLVLHQVPMLSQLSARGILAALFVSIVACVLCYAVLYWLLNHVDGHKLSLFDGVHAISATVFGMLIFHETLSIAMGVGGALIIAGLVIGNFQVTPIEKQIE